MIDIEELLKPISAEKSCGDDLSYDPAFLELEGLMRGKPETQFSPAEDPNWKQVREHCLGLWKRSKDLRIATALSVAELKMEGFSGFHACLGLLNGLVETFWGDLYPRLDPADGNDPTERVNIVASLAAPVGTFGDPMKVLERLREAPLTQSVQMGRFSFADLLRSEGGTPGPDEKPPPSADQIKAAFRDTGSDELTQLAQVLSASAALVDQLDERLTSAVGADKAADLSPLKREFLDIQKRLAPYLPEGTVAVEEGAGEAGAPAEPGAAPKAITGEIQSRQDVIRMLQKICDYYSRHEPSSPVPYLLKRAERLAEKNFMEIINDMSPEALEQITRITGAESAAEAPPPAEGGG